MEARACGVQGVASLTMSPLWGHVAAYTAPLLGGHQKPPRSSAGTPRDILCAFVSSLCLPCSLYLYCKVFGGSNMFSDSTWHMLLSCLAPGSV